MEREAAAEWREKRIVLAMASILMVVLLFFAAIPVYAAGGASDTLELALQMSGQKAGAGSFTSEYPQQEGASGTSFSFSTTLINNGLAAKSYSLSSNAPAGWSVSFTPSAEATKIAGIDVEPGESKGITVSVIPPEKIAAGTYDISCSAVSADETLKTDLKVVITGTYGLTLTTPDGRLSFDAYSNKESDVTLHVTNTGNVDLENVAINSSVPTGWTVTYSNLEENVITSIPAGTTTEVIAHVQPGSDAITGDYIASFTASSDGVSGSADFRVSVKTRTLWMLWLWLSSLQPQVAWDIQSTFCLCGPEKAYSLEKKNMKL